MQAVTQSNAPIGQQRAEAASNRNVLAGPIIASALGVAGLLAAMLSYGGSRFYHGSVLRDAVKAEIGERAKAGSAASPTR